MTDFSRVKQNLEARGFRVSVFATAAEAAEVRSMPAQSRPVSGRESFMVELLKTCV